MAARFYLDSRPSKTGDYPIKVNISINGIRLYSTIGYNAGLNDWDNSHQTMKPKTQNAKGVAASTINLRIKKIIMACEELAQDREPVTKQRIIDALAQIVGTKRRTAKASTASTILEYFDEFIRSEGKTGQWTYGTFKQWNSFRKHLQAFGCGTLTFDSFNEQGMNDFISYLRNDCEMSENTARKRFRTLKWFLNWSIRKGYATDSQISKCKPKFKVLDKPVIFLTNDELLRLYNYEIPANGTIITLHNNKGKEYKKTITDAAALAKTRDLFCFCAFTSLRFSDMQKLRKIDIYGDSIHVTTQKTNDSLNIELNDYSRAILAKYEAIDIPQGRALPIISNQRMNEYIKTLGELCEINTPITRTLYKAGQKVVETLPKYEMLGTHAGRRTFICTALGFGIAPQVVMKWTGHSDYKAMQPYIDIAEATKAEKMQLFNDLKQ